MLEVEKGVCEAYADHIVLNCKRLSIYTTFQGIDNCGWRLCENILEVVQDYKTESDGRDEISSISFIGYSLGGLICRYCVGLLQIRSFFDKVKPMHLITIATPHLGTRLRHRTLSGRVINFVGSWIVNLYAGRSGGQIALLDGDENTEPLLLEMTRLQSCFMQGLRKFPHLYVYANVSNDNTVPYCTSALSYKNNWKSMGSASQLSSGEDKYSFILETKKIREDADVELYKDKHTSKQYEWSFCNLLLILGVLTLGLPFLIIHILLLALPLRLISLLYAFPDESNLCPRLHVEGNDRVDPDLCPWIILKNMREDLDIHRVAVMIPGAHTHGKIVCRFQPNRGGLEVIRHLVKEVLSLQSIQKTVADTALDEDVTDININM